MKINIQQLDIPKATASAAAALEIVNQPEPDSRALEQAIMQDPVLASTLLRYANSPMMARPMAVTNVPNAITLLGMNSVRSAVITATIRSLLPKENVVCSVILQHVVLISELCKLIADRCCRDAASDLEFLGLVHDLGILTFVTNFTKDYTKLFHRALVEGLNLDRLEIDEYGISHSAVSAHTAHSFRLPILHIALLHEFHDRNPLTEIVSEKDRDIAVLALAHRIYVDQTDEPIIRDTIPENESQLVKLLGLSADQLDIIKQQYQTAISFANTL